MKSSLCIALGAAALALITVVTAGAEQFNPALVGYGGKLGVNIANVSNHPSHPDNHTGYLIGGLVYYPLTRLISFQMEIMISGKGFAVPDTTVYDADNNFLRRADATWIFQYLEMPFLAKLSPSTTGKYRPYIIAGGFFAFLIDSKQRMSDSMFQLDYELPNANDIDMGGIGGIGIDLKAGRGWVFFEARYEQGLVSVLKDSDFRSRTLSFQAGYWF